MRNSQAKAPEEKPRRGRPATTPEGREQQLVTLAIDLAEQQLRDGTASAQVISHYLKAGSTREYVELELKREQIAAEKLKQEAYQSQQRTEEMYEEVINAMKRYSGVQEDQGIEVDDDF